MYVDNNEYMLKILMIEHNDFLYKGESYANKDYNIIVRNELCCVEQSKRNRDGKVSLLVRKPNNKLFFIEGTQDDIDRSISDVVLKQSRPQAQQQYEHPDAISIGAGICWYIIAMVVSSLFKGNWLLWILITIIFITWYSNKPKFKTS